jgi:4'-phosphopantetheinyl transferase
MSPDRELDVFLWRLRFSEEDDVELSRGVLSEQERAHAARLRSAAARKRYVYGRTCLRRILSLYRGQPESAIELGESTTGKPFAEGIEFNLSHARDEVVYAIGRDLPLGIDIEQPAQIAELDALLFVCSEREARYVRAHGASGCSAAFLRLWTRKEAVLKAAGCGLGRVGPDAVEVLDDVVSIGGERWRLTDVPLTGLICALATHGAAAPTFEIIDLTNEPNGG